MSHMIHMIPSILDWFGLLRTQNTQIFICYPTHDDTQQCIQGGGKAASKRDPAPAEWSVRPQACASQSCCLLLFPGDDSSFDWTHLLGGPTATTGPRLRPQRMYSNPHKTPPIGAPGRRPDAPLPPRHWMRPRPPLAPAIQRAGLGRLGARPGTGASARVYVCVCARACTCVCVCVCVCVCESLPGAVEEPHGARRVARVDCQQRGG
jgi:hypothetical protein